MRPLTQDEFAAVQDLKTPRAEFTVTFDEFQLPVKMSRGLDSREIKLVYTRTWKERLFSRPWRPFKRQNEVTMRTAAPPQVECDGESMTVRLAIDPNSMRHEP